MQIVVSQEEWPSWVEDTCINNGWAHPYYTSPLIWRELIDRGGKGVYMGSLEDFVKYTNHYYNIVPDTTDELDMEIAKENYDSYNTLKLEEAQNKPADPLRVCITNASSSLAYHLASRVLLDNVFGDQIIHLQLLDANDNQEIVHGLAMELEDLAHPNLSMVTCTDSVQEAFKAVSAVFVLDEFVLDEFRMDDENTMITEDTTNGNEETDRRQIFGTIDSKNDVHDEEGVDIHTEENRDNKTMTPNESENVQNNAAETEQDDEVFIRSESANMETNDKDVANEAVLREAAMKYDMYGGLLDYVAQKNVRVIIVGQFSNTGAALMSRRVSSIDKKNFVSSSSLVESQASSVLASKLGVATSDIKQVGIWGCSQGISILPDTLSAVVYHYQGSVVGPDDYSLSIKKCLFDYKWLKEDFPAIVVDRHNNSSCYGERGAYLAEAVSLSKLMKDWWTGVEAWHSVGVVHEGEDIAVTYPCIGKNGVWEKIENATLEEGNAEKLAKIVSELKKEFEKAASFLENNSESNVTVTPASKL